MRIGTPQVPIDRIVVGERVRKDLGDIKVLAASIKEVGLLHPIVVDADYRLIAGRRRLAACKSLGWKKIPVHIIPLKDIFLGEFHENMVRKGFTVSEMVYLQRAIEPEIKSRTIKGRPKKGANIAPLSTGKVRLNVAKFVGTSHTTLKKATKIVEAAEADPELFGDILKSVDSGKTTINHAYTKIKRREKHEHPPALPEGIFDVIYADPPWPYYLPLRGAPDAHYKTMSIENICNLEVEGVSIQEKIADNAILFLWTTNPQNKVAHGVIESWGFIYKTNLVWVKDKWGTGHYFRGQHELLLTATRGDIPPPVEEVRTSSVLNATVREHSRKPDEVYDMIEKMYPGRKYLELFARNWREGWTSWGLEAISPPQNDQSKKADYLDYNTVLIKEGA